jgi:hypothetical protein
MADAPDRRPDAGLHWGPDLGDFRGLILSPEFSRWAQTWATSPGRFVDSS